MALALKKPSKGDLIFLIPALLFIPFILFIFQVFGIIFTLTGSVPIGFYRIIPMKEIHRGDYVSFCLPDDIAQLGMRRGYINKGRCENGSEPLIKEVIGVPGDIVSIGDHFIKINNIAYLMPAKQFDKNNLPIKRNVTLGNYKLRGYWMYGSGDYINSWDSRYYGSISIKRSVHKLEKFLLF